MTKQLTKDERVAIIDETLIYHHNRKVDGKLQCLCGEPMQLGRSIYQHQAEVIDAALRFAEEGTIA